MLFNEVYSAYYNTIAKLINKAIDGELNDKTAIEIINSTAFSESFLYILPTIKNEEWQVITKDFKTPIKHKATMPTTLLQKRFLKAISIDKRFKLFADTIDGLEDIEPLYNIEDFYIFDIINDGDPFDNRNYIENFRTVLQAVKEKKRIKISFTSGKGYSQQNTYTPRKLEYSQKDDKFRLICGGKFGIATINLARITHCELAGDFSTDDIIPFSRKKNKVLLNITSERNALERSMLHFANFEKSSQMIDDKHYQMELSYNKEDETEVLIRILSFGPMVKVVEPESFINLIKERLNNQKKLVSKD